MVEPFIQLVPASQFSLEELAAAYNHARVDYLVPMPMDTAHLAMYMEQYDISLERSLVAVEGELILGIGMLGVREGRTWITRLGVLPAGRRKGIGEALVNGLLAASNQPGIGRTFLEVIQGNEPARQLFLKLGFLEKRNLLVLRRPASRPMVGTTCRAAWLDRCNVLEKVRGLTTCCSADNCPAWTNQVESFEKIPDIQGLEVDFETGEHGWLVFSRQELLLSHLIFETERGDAGITASALLFHLYQRFPLEGTYTENLSAADPHLSAMKKAGFVEVFRRIEMERHRS